MIDSELEELELHAYLYPIAKEFYKNTRNIPNGMCYKHEGHDLFGKTTEYVGRTGNGTAYYKKTAMGHIGENNTVLITTMGPEEFAEIGGEIPRNANPKEDGLIVGINGITYRCSATGNFHVGSEEPNVFYNLDSVICGLIPKAMQGPEPIEHN